MHHTKPLWSVTPLFIIIFIDSMGLGLLFPILNDILVDPASSFLPDIVSASQRELIYGGIIAIFMLAWFFGAAILGDLSDRIGRKKVLMLCLAGTFVGYLLAGLSVLVHSMVLLVVGRIIAGFTAGSQPIAQAALIDISAPQKKARNLGLMVLAASLGFVFGPICGGVFSDNSLVSWFNFETPFYFAAILAVLNFGLLWRWFHETHQIKEPYQFRLYQALMIFIDAFKDRRIRFLSLVYLILVFGSGSYYTFISMFMLKRYHTSPLEISLFMAVMGVGYAFGAGVLVGFLSKRYILSRLVILACFVSALSVFVTLLFSSEAVAWAMTCLFGIAIAVAYSLMLALFSNQVDEMEQGWIMGVTCSIWALSYGVNALFLGKAASFSVSMPLVFSMLGLLLSGVILFFYQPRRFIGA
jgi:MFS transporter, DHA1 family, tetracycline resistance protein